MARKTKTPQPQTPDEVQGRDLFQTPNYAVDLLIPFIPKYIKMIWECAAGNGKIVDRLRTDGYYIWATDINMNSKVHELKNFLNQTPSEQPQCIITNPPFSLKYKFINRALEYNVPFAFLIPFDMCQKMARLFMIGCQGLVPTKRIDYITPTGLSGATGHTSYYHSLWLTYKFNLPNQLTFVELTKQMKENI